MTVAQSELATADGQIREAQSALAQAQDELAVRTELFAGAGVISEREIERLQVVVDGRQAGLDAALANKATQQTRIASLLPARRRASRPSSPRRRSSSTRCWCGPASPGPCSSSCCARATS